VRTFMLTLFGTLATIATAMLVVRPVTAQEPTKLKIPMLVLTSEKASGEFLITQARLVDDNVDGVVIMGSGHWLIDEALDQVAPRLVAFFRR
jgi:hypothetical protein